MEKSEQKKEKTIDYKVRVVDEYAGLVGKIDRLKTFLSGGSVVIATLPKEEVALLQQQLSAMTDYKLVLRKRIILLLG